MAFFAIAAAAVVAVGAYALLSRPRRGSTQPALEDLKVTTSSYGTPIPIIEGHPRVPGIVIWASDKRAIAHTEEVGGKGGGGVESTTYTYEVDVLMLVSANTIAGIPRVWKDGKLVFTRSALSSSASLLASGAAEHWTDMIVYPGGPSQLPDPTYEAALGVGNVPAYRDCGTVMFKSLKLDGGGNLPNLTFEVPRTATSGSASAVTVHDFTDSGRYFLTSTTDTTDRSGANYNDSAWLTGPGPYGNAPHPNGPLSGVNPQTIIALNQSVWLRFSFHCNVGDAVAVTAYYDDNGPTLWINGVVQTIVTSSNFNGTVNYTATVEKQVFAFRVNDTGVNIYSALRVVVTPAALTPLDESLSSVVSRLCLRAGLTAGDIDVTALAGPIVRGMAISQVTSARQVIETLMQAYDFDAVESDKLRFVFRGGASVATLPYDSLGVSTGQPGEPLPIRLRNDIELPAQVSVRYSNLDNDYQEGSELSDRLITASTAVEVLEMPLVLTATEAKRIADRKAMSLAVGKTSIGPLALTRDYSHLEPTDVVTATDFDGSTFRLRLARKTEADGVLAFEAGLDDASVLSSAAATDTGYTPSTVVTAPVDTVLELLDIPILRDADNDAGYYIAAKGSAAPWPGAVVYRSRDDVDYTQQTTVTESAVTGVCTTTLADWTGTNVFDEVNSLTVNVGAGTLAGTTRDNVLDAGANAALVGSEVIQFRDAALVSAGVYKISGLLRGRRGTEWAMSGHAAGERFVPLRTTGLRRLAVQTDEIGQLRYLRGVTLGRSLATATPKTITPAAVGLKPFAPVDLRKAVPLTSAVLLLHMNGTNGSATFTDVMGSIFTAAGNAQISTAQSKYGGAAGLFDGAGDYISAPSAAKFNFGPADFTVQMWFRCVALPSSGSYHSLIARWGDGASANRQFSLYLNNNAGTIRLQAGISLNGTTQINTHLENTSITTGVWYHVAWVRSGTSILLFLDGVQLGTAYNIGTNAIYSPSSTVVVGAVQDSGGTHIFFLNGYVDDVQINAGEAIYTANFTPPSAELPDPVAGDIALTWSRRTRLAKNFSNGAVPLGEASEAYDVEIFADGSYAVVKRTLAGLTSAAATYTAAQQIADFGAAQSTVYTRIYQRSAIVGRGYAAQAAL